MANQAATNVWSSLFSRKQQLPKRLQAELKKREDSAEILIGWAQLTIITLFAILYALAPRAEGAEGFNFVPSAIAVYFLFTLIRLFLSYQRSLPPAIVVLSIVADLALLLGIIFSFHIQYEQHPTFYLKTPTMMYIFLFISLRALRFDPLYVIIAGLLAACGWLALVGYAVLSDMGGMLVTRNYVEYLTSNSILLGAELDKIIIITSVTGILALALQRGRMMLIEAIREHIAVGDFKRFFPPEVARIISQADEAPMVGTATTRSAAILIIDIRQFTTISKQLSPETALKILASYQAIAVPIIQQAGGRIDKFLGDGILATFGAVEETTTYAADAIDAGQRVVAAMKKAQSGFASLGWPSEFRIGCAISCGPVTIGTVGTESRLEFTVIGDCVNLAAKLEDANKSEASQLIADAFCVETARTQKEIDVSALEHLKDRPVKGISRPLDLYILPDHHHQPNLSDQAAKASAVSGHNHDNSSSQIITDLPG